MMKKTGGIITDIPLSLLFCEFTKGRVTTLIRGTPYRQFKFYLETLESPSVYNGPIRNDKPRTDSERCPPHPLRWLWPYWRSHWKSGEGPPDLFQLHKFVSSAPIVCSTWTGGWDPWRSRLLWWAGGLKMSKASFGGGVIDGLAWIES